MLAGFWHMVTQTQRQKGGEGGNGYAQFKNASFFLNFPMLQSSGKNPQVGKKGMMQTTSAKIRFSSQAT